MRTWITTAAATAAAGLLTAAVVHAQLSPEPASRAGAASVAVADDQVCLRAEDAVGAIGTCAPASEAARDGVLLTSRGEAMEVLALYALLPDGAREAALSGPSGERPVAIVDGVVATGPTDATHLTWVDGAGVRHTRALP